MPGAKGTINAFTRGGRLVYEAIYQSSYRHNAYRVCAMAIGEAVDTAPMHPTERAAFAELESRARLDGVDITIEAGSYENGARKRFPEIARELREIEGCTNAWKLTTWEPSTVRSLYDDAWIASVERVNRPMGRWYRRGRYAYFAAASGSYKVFYAA